MDYTTFSMMQTLGLFVLCSVLSASLIPLIANIGRVVFSDDWKVGARKQDWFFAIILPVAVAIFAFLFAGLVIKTSYGDAEATTSWSTPFEDYQNDGITNQSNYENRRFSE